MARQLLRASSASPPDWYTDGHWYYDGFSWAIAAETAVIAGRPDAHERLATAAPAATESPWAHACLTRAGGRLDDLARLERSVAAWERIGARLERACTLLLPCNPSARKVLVDGRT